jgi:hypothetical protein
VPGNRHLSLQCVKVIVVYYFEIPKKLFIGRSDWNEIKAKCSYSLAHEGMISVYCLLHHYRAGPVEARLSQKFQKSANSTANRIMCPMVCTISKCYKGITGVQMCVWCSSSSFVRKYQEVVSSISGNWLHSKDTMWWEKVWCRHWRAISSPPDLCLGLHRELCVCSTPKRHYRVERQDRCSILTNHTTNTG